MLRTLDVDGNLVTFNLEDSPIYVYADRIVLLKRTNSKFIIAKMIHYYSEMEEVGEGDEVFYEGEKVGIIYYNCGFKIKFKSGFHARTNSTIAYTICKGNKESIKELLELEVDRSKPSYLDNYTNNISLREITLVTEGRVYLKHGPILKLENMYLNSGIEGKPYGKYVAGGIVTEISLKPQVLNNF